MTDEKKYIHYLMNEAKQSKLISLENTRSEKNISKMFLLQKENLKLYKLLPVLLSNLLTEKSGLKND